MTARIGGRQGKKGKEKEKVRSGGQNRVRIKKMTLLMKTKIGRKKGKVENIVLTCDQRGAW